MSEINWMDGWIPFDWMTTPPTAGEELAVEDGLGKSCVRHANQPCVRRMGDSIVKVKGIAVYGTPSHSYGVSLAIWDQTMLPATRHM